MKRQLPDELLFLSNRNKEQHVSTETMQGKTVVITGATSGVGKAALIEFIKGNASVLVVGRNEEKIKELQKELNVSFPYVLADFSDLSDVKRAAEDVVKFLPKIDCLINSVGMHSTTKKYTKDGYELVFQVNHLATLLFTNIILEKMRTEKKGRIIQVNSEGHRFNGLRLHDLHWKKRVYTGLRGYGASKTAQLHSVWELDKELKGTGITINAMHPGDVKTAIGSNNGLLYRFWTKIFTNRLLRDVTISGKALYYLASSKDLESVSGKFFHLTIEEPPAKHAVDVELGKKCHEASLTLIKNRL